MPIGNVTFELLREESERKEAMLFAHRMAHYWYQCGPSDVPHYIFAAQKKDALIATLGITHSKDENPLPMRHCYHIPTHGLPRDFSWRDTAQFSWFFSEEKGIFPLLLLMGLRFSQAENKTYGVLQMKETIFTLLTKKGFYLNKIPDATLILEAIPLVQRGYYLDETKVNAYYFEVAENIVSVERYVKEHLRSHYQAAITSKFIQLPTVMG